MKILASFVDKTTVELLQTLGLIVESEEITTSEELLDWLRVGMHDAFVIHLDKSKAGMYLPREVRHVLGTIPIVGISSRDVSSWSDHRALFLENGGDDLLRDPVNPRELVATLRCIARRSAGSHHDVKEYFRDSTHIKINHVTRVIHINGVEPDLTGKERDMLILLGSAPGRIWSKEAFINQLYVNGVEDPPEMKIIDVYICKIRKKLNKVDPVAARMIETVWGRGYTLMADRCV